MKKLLIASLLVSIGIMTQAQSHSLWEINLMKINDKKNTSDYLRLLQANYGEVRELGIKEKYVLSYKILQDTTTTRETSWDFMLVTEYASKELMHKFEKDYSMLSKKARPNGALKINGKNFNELGKSLYYTVLLNDPSKGN